MGPVSPRPTSGAWAGWSHQKDRNPELLGLGPSGKWGHLLCHTLMWTPAGKCTHRAAPQENLNPRRMVNTSSVRRRDNYGTAPPPAPPALKTESKFLLASPRSTQFKPLITARPLQAQPFTGLCPSSQVHQCLRQAFPTDGRQGA